MIVQTFTDGVLVREWDDGQPEPVAPDPLAALTPEQAAAIRAALGI